MVRDLTPDEAKDAISKAKILFIDAWAPWCGPCLALAPTIEELEEKYADNSAIQFMKLNTQDHRSFAMENNISAIPCVLVYKNGEPASFEIDGRKNQDRIIGLRPIHHFEEVIKQLL